MFQDMIKQLEEAEDEMVRLKRENSRLEQYLVLVMRSVKEVEVDTLDLLDMDKFDIRNVRLLPRKHNYDKVKIIYDEGDNTDKLGADIDE